MRSVTSSPALHLFSADISCVYVCTVLPLKVRMMSFTAIPALSAQLSATTLCTIGPTGSP